VSRRRQQRWILLSSFFAFGIMFGIWQVLLEDLRLALGLATGPLGIGLTLGSLCSFPLMVYSGRVIGRSGARSVAFWSSVLLGGCFLVLPFVPTFAVLLMLLVVFFAASAIFDVGINAAAIEYERIWETRFLPQLHGSFSGAAAVGALAAGALLSAGVPFRGIYWIVTIVYAGLAFALLRADFPVAEIQTHEGGARLDLFTCRPLLAVALLTCAAYFLEGAVETWAVIYLRSSVALPAFFAAVAGAVFYAAMLAGRLTTTLVVTRLGRLRVVQIAGAFSLAGLALALVTALPALIVAGFLLCGLALAAVAPITFSLAGDIVPGRAGDASAVLTTIGYAGFLIGPSILGAFAEVTSLRLALLAAGLAGAFISLQATRIREPVASVSECT
jgi:MFS family permease